MALKLTGFQRQLLDLIQRAQLLRESYKEKNINVFFDFPCINDDCSGRNGKRVMATAWKTKDDKYEIYCASCGQADKIDKDIFRQKKMDFSKEQAHLNMEKASQELKKSKRQSKNKEDKENL